MFECEYHRKGTFLFVNLGREFYNVLDIIKSDNELLDITLMLLGMFLFISA